MLLSRELEPVVDMVAWSQEGGVYDVASADGAVRFRRNSDANDEFVVEDVTGQNPITVQEQTRFVGIEAERATPHPNRRLNSYPHGFEQFAQLLIIPRLPMCA